MARRLQALDAAIDAMPPGRPMPAHLAAEAKRVADLLIVTLLDGELRWTPAPEMLSAERCAEARRSIGAAAAAKVRGAVKTAEEQRQLIAIALPLLSSVDAALLADTESPPFN